MNYEQRKKYIDKTGLNGLVFVEDVKAPMPLLRAEVAIQFYNMQNCLLKHIGYDFFAIVGDMCRPANLHSNKAGVAFRSHHKCGNAIDYNQNSKDYILEPEFINGKIYFVTWLRVKLLNEDVKKLLDTANTTTRNWYSKNGVKKIWQNGKLAMIDMKYGEWFNLTECAKTFSFTRIPAWSSWKLTHGYSTKMEFWHYQNLYKNGVSGEEMSYEQSMQRLKDMSPATFVNKGMTIDEFTKHRSGLFQQETELKTDLLRMGDSGDKVLELQVKLVLANFLDEHQADGFFRTRTDGAVRSFQASVGLKPDGVVGQLTESALNEKINFVGELANLKVIVDNNLTNKP
jgi:Putative peptidoglycan binding domain